MLKTLQIKSLLCAITRYKFGKRGAVVNKRQIFTPLSVFGYNYTDLSSAGLSSEPLVIEFINFGKTILISSILFGSVFLWAASLNKGFLTVKFRLIYLLFLLWIFSRGVSLLYKINSGSDLIIENPEIWVSSGQLVIFNFFVVMIIGTILLFEVKENTQTGGQKWKDSVVALHLGLIFVLIFCYNVPVLILILEALSLTTAILLLSRCNVRLESVIKYFIASSISTSIIVSGISIIFWKEHTLSYDEVSYLFYKTNMLTGETIPFLNLYVIALISIGFLIKLGLFPYHAWAIDVFSGLSTSTLFYLSVPYKLTVLMVGLKFFHMVGVFQSTQLTSIYIGYFLVLGCLFLGNAGAWGALSFNRFIGFTSLNNLGYFFLLGFTNEPDYLGSIILYIFLYVLGNAVFFLTVSRYNLRPLIIEDVFRKAPNIFCFTLLTISILSLAGMPPFGGFWAKIFLFINMYKSKQYFLMLAIIISSAISIVYYSRVLFPIWTKGLNLLLLKSYPSTSLIQFTDTAVKIRNKQFTKIPSFIKITLSWYQDIFNIILCIMLFFPFIYLESQLGYFFRDVGITITFYKWNQAHLFLHADVYKCLDDVFNHPHSRFLQENYQTFSYMWSHAIRCLTIFVQLNLISVSDFSIWLEIFNRYTPDGLTEADAETFRFLTTKAGRKFTALMTVHMHPYSELPFP